MGKEYTTEDMSYIAFIARERLYHSFIPYYQEQYVNSAIDLFKKRVNKIEYVSTKNGNRLGRGKGYYDRLLPHLTNAYKAGICFPYQVVDEVPVEDSDIPMDAIISLL